MELRNAARRRKREYAFPHWIDEETRIYGALGGDGRGLAKSRSTWAK